MITVSPWISEAATSPPGSRTVQYGTPSGLVVERTARSVEPAVAIRRMVRDLDDRPGAVFRSAVTQPGRYVPWLRGTDRPALAFEARGRAFRLTLLDPDAGALFDAACQVLRHDEDVSRLWRFPDGTGICGAVRRAPAHIREEDRTRRPSTVGVLRRLAAAFAHDDESLLGWYGAFGYDLVIGFDPIPRRRRRPADQRDIVAYLPSSVLAADPERGTAVEVSYRFIAGSAPDAPRPTYRGLVTGRCAEPVPVAPDPARYAEGVRSALRAFHAGDAFEIVLSQTFAVECAGVRPSAVFERLTARNPSPYGFLVNLGRGEVLVGASPEMFVRVGGDVVETCPISGTISRGADALEEARNIQRLLESEKDAAELTMCTDVDRNDKARICEPGTVRVLARRQIETYSRLIHTVDHVEGRLRPGYDAWDAFLTHMWAATVTGAPKRAATDFIEQWEDSPRRWYGGAVGFATFNGEMNTGMTLRAARIVGSVAEVRAGATLLIGSDPEAEEAETRLKATAVLDALSEPARPGAGAAAALPVVEPGDREPALDVLVIDHEDSFVHTLAGYLRESGCSVTTRRWSSVDRVDPGTDLVVLSPGPGRPADFRLDRSIAAALDAGAAVFGVCLGLQGIVEFFGGDLEVLPMPVHGRASPIAVTEPGSAVFDGLPVRFGAGRYHSLCVRVDHVRPPLVVTAATDDGVVMAVRHEWMPVSAVQFHPESLLTLDGDNGHRLIDNVVRAARVQRCATPV